MSRPLKLRFPPLQIIEVAGPLTWPDFDALLNERLESGVSFVLLQRDGPRDRGGYFFHLKREEQTYIFSTFDREGVCTFGSGEECAEFINHVAGLAYSEGMWAIAQLVNLRTDAN